MDATIIPFPRGSTAPETPNLPAVPEPLEGEIVPAPTAITSLPVTYTDKRLHRPAWLGVDAGHRAAARTASWQATKRVCGRSWWELWCGIPTRIWHVVRWFGRGLICLVVLARWIFAVDERADLRKPGIPPGRAALIGAKVDLSWKLRGGFVLVANVGFWLAVWHWVPPGEVPWPALFADHLFELTSAKVAWIAWGVPWVVAVTIYGVLHDEKPPAPVVAPRAREDVNVIAMNDALRSVGILAKPTTNDAYPDGVRLAAPPKPTGNAGQETVFDLPASCGKSAADVIRERDRLAGAFATPRDRFVIELGAHEAQFAVWTSARDPFAGKAPEHPLMRVAEWNVWDRYPFAHDVRGEHVHYSVPLTSDLTGSRPRRGKSYAVRSKLVGAVLDPTVRFHVFDGKGGATWAGLEPLADTFIEGSDHEDVAKVADALETLVADMRERARRIPGSVVTRLTVGDAPITVVVVDEAQRYIEHKKHGDRITEALVTLAQTGPSTGYALFIITQRPDAASFPSELRAVMGSRLALEVMTWSDSNVILGPDMSKLGHDASKINHRGVGIYRPDDDADGQPDDDPGTTRMVRMFDMSDDAWAAICEIGAALRARAELPAIGMDTEPDEDDEQLPATTLYVRFRDHAPETLPGHVIDGQTTGNWLAGLGVKASRLSDGTRVRSRVSVERAVRVSRGCLAGVDTEDSDTSPTPPRHLSTPPLTPPLTPVSTPHTTED